jgi:hypothetical protein
MDPLQVLEKVNSFYSNAFSQLLTLTIAVLAVAGVILPIVVQIIQTRTFRTEQKSLQTQISTELGAVRSELLAVIEGKFETEKGSFKKLLDEHKATIDAKLNEQVLVAKGGTFFVQGKLLLNQNDYDAAAADYVTAARFLLEGQDDMNGQRALNILERNCLPQLNRESFEKDDLELDELFQGLLEILEEKNMNSRFSDTIGSIRSGLSKAKKREKARAEATTSIVKS